MKKYTQIFVVVFLIPLFAGAYAFAQDDNNGNFSYTDISYSDNENERQQIISDSLDRAIMLEQVNTQPSFALEDIPKLNDLEMPSQNYVVIPYPPEEKTGKRQYEQTQKVVAKTKDTNKKEYEPVSQKKNNLSALELGTEAYYYRYREPTLNVKLDGEYYGIYGIYTFRTQENKPLTSFQDVFTKNSKINMFRFEGRYAWGWVDYDGSFTYGDLEDHVFELRGMAGYDIPVSPSLLVTPYMGFGYRYLNDGLDQIPAQTVGGLNYYSGYNRESKYGYIPIGIDAKKSFDNDWSLLANLEYDLFLFGEQVSHFEDMQDLSGDNAGFSALQNDQDSGFGMRASLKVMRSTDKIDLFAEPFVRYWKIDDSGGAVSCNGSTGYCIGGYEPKNVTREYGMKFGINYN